MKNALPCPFCGCKKARYQSDMPEHVEGHLSFVECDRCGALGPWTDQGRIRALEYWNRRAQEKLP